METFPAFFPLAGRRVVIAGEGEAAEAKARLFENSPAVVVRVAAASARDPTAYEGAALIFVAAQDESLAREAARAARTAGAPLNVVDHPELSDFHTPGIIDRGQVVVAIGTAGAAPVLASLLRAEIEARIPLGAGVLARLLAERRGAIRTAYADLGARRDFFRRILAGPAMDAAGSGDLALAAETIDSALAQGDARLGGVSLIEAPIQADRLSLRAVRALSVADAVVMGEGATPIVEAHARRDVERWDARDAGALGAAALTGQLIAVVDRHPDRQLEGALRAMAVRVEFLAPAPCP